MIKIDLTDERQIGDLKKSFESAFKGPLNELTLSFLEEFCGFELGGPRGKDDLDDKVLQYEAGKRDVILTIKTIMSGNWSPKEIAEYYRKVG